MGSGCRAMLRLMVRVELHDAADAVTKIDRGLALAESEDQDNARLLIGASGPHSRCMLGCARFGRTCAVGGGFDAARG